MITKILATFFAISISFATTLGQTGYSESTPYEPKALAKPDKNKKGDDGKVVQIVDAEETISIPISVFDKEDSVLRDIAKGEVTVYADGVEVPLNSFDKQAEPLNVILVLDTSPSATQRLETIKGHASKLVKELPQSAQVMVVEFHADMNVLSQMTADRKETEKAIRKAKMGDGTSIYSAIATLFQKVFPLVPGRKSVILMTDGVDTTSRKANYSTSLVEVERSDVSIYPVLYETMNDNPRRSGLSQDWIAEILRQNGRAMPPGAISGGSAAEYQRGKDYLRDLAEASGGRVIPAEKFDGRVASLAAELLGKYYATVTVPKRGAVASRPLKVRISRPRLKVHARGSFIE